MNPHLTTLISHLPADQLTTITGATAQLRNGDVHYPFRQDSDFLYLTGLSVPGLVLTIFSDAVILWREPITDIDIIWGSDKLSDTELRDISGVEYIRDISEVEQYQSGKKEIGYQTWKSFIHSLRLIKTPYEIDKIRKGISVSQEAFTSIHSMMRPGIYEYEIEAEIARVFRSHHLTEAYPSIVASGPNACILHYTAHTRQLQLGDLILIDAGAEYMGYASDMTRTFAVSGFSPRQLAVYDAVERVKKIAENTLKPGISLTEYEAIMRIAMNRELYELGLIPQHANKDEVILLSKKYYPHRTSHFLGLDVHDVGSRDLILSPGMVVTIEPGIYVTDEQIGVRIEDDYLITKSGCERLS
ncbi:aminopeptidase P N-terminal domain-containing protein [Candidatus Gracilibacteria bacterium]|nr:aminopeptidase P N-terminal domain-containing protein [Candidatus Gracilibacteria bacterium]